MSKIAIIGTAGRDKKRPMTLRLWQWMVEDATKKVPKGAHVVSGGAAWADHLAVHLFLSGHAGNLTLRLPAPFHNDRFIGGYGTSGGAANYYHGLFSDVLGYDTRAQITECAAADGCDGSFEPEAHGYDAMKTRNAKVAAECTSMLAYTFGDDTYPADGGTRHTWDLCHGKRIHISLPMWP